MAVTPLALITPMTLLLTTTCASDSTEDEKLREEIKTMLDYMNERHSLAELVNLDLDTTMRHMKLLNAIRFSR